MNTLNYENELMNECEQRAATLLGNLKTTSDMLQVDKEIVEDVKQKETDAASMAVQELKELKSVLQTVVKGNKRIRFMFYYIIVTFIMLSQICRFL